MERIAMDMGIWIHGSLGLYVVLHSYIAFRDNGNRNDSS